MTFISQEISLRGLGMKNFFKIFLLLLSSLIVLAGCMGDVSKRIRIDGSATVLPITQAVVEEFAKEHRDIEIAVSASGTGGGFKKFINNETDIQNASRPIREVEREDALRNQVDYYELAIAKDAIVMVVNKDNTWVQNFTDEELYKIFKVDSKISLWSDINPTWPATKINFYLPALDSGTFDYFHENVMQGNTEVRADATSSQDFNVLVTGVEGDKNALGFFSYAYYQAAKEKVHALSVNQIAPDRLAIINNEYPLARDLYIYVNKNNYLNKIILRQFVSYYLEHVAMLVEEVGLIPLSNAAYQIEKEKLLDR